MEIGHLSSPLYRWKIYRGESPLGEKRNPYSRGDCRSPFFDDEKIFLNDRGRNLKTHNSIIYYYAESLDKRYRWSGDHRETINGRTVLMKRKQIDVDNRGNFVLGIR